MPCITIQGNTYETDLVIFDKDGTLLDFGETWIGIFRDFFSFLGQHVHVTPALKDRIESALGIFVDKNHIDGNGAIAMGTFTECNALLTYSLYREGLRWDSAQAIVEKVGRQAFSSEARKKHLKPACGGVKLLQTLKSRGIAVAVATNDKYADALVDMEYIGALSFLDLVVGADSVEHSKPAPDMVDKICAFLGKSAGRAVLIGDTVMDAMLGKNSGVMLTVGVCGIVPEKELREHMSLVVSSLEEIA